MNVRLERQTAMTTRNVQTVKAHTTVFVNLDLQEMGQLAQVGTLAMETLLFIPSLIDLCCVPLG